MSHVVLAGGVGAARYLTGALEAFDPATVTGIVNVADDVVLHGLHVSPDLDTCTYTLAGAIDPERGWGLVDETWQAMAELGRYGGRTGSVLATAISAPTSTARRACTTAPPSPRSPARSRRPGGWPAGCCRSPTTVSKPASASPTIAKLVSRSTS